MSQQLWKPVMLAVASLSLSALLPLNVGAQDRDEHQDQRAQEHQDQRARDHQDEQPRHEDHGDAMSRGDPATQYRHDHPRASARCHDGFFTNTKDRGRACSKHGGIDVWLAL